jgi:hypothetical protein
MEKHCGAPAPPLFAALNFHQNLGFCTGGFSVCCPKSFQFSRKSVWENVYTMRVMQNGTYL